MIGNDAKFDIAMHNGLTMAIVEVEHTAHPNNLDQVEQQMHLHFELFRVREGYLSFCRKYWLNSQHLIPHMACPACRATWKA